MISPANPSLYIANIREGTDDLPLNAYLAIGLPQPNITYVCIY